MEMIVDRVGIIQEGEIKKEGKLSDLIFHSVTSYEIVFSGIAEKILTDNRVKFVLQDKNYLSKAETNEDTNKTIRLITKNRGKILAVTPVKMTLEDIFLEEINQ